jgi:uncharacterized membrane protein YidH (DUF202 family)
MKLNYKRIIDVIRISFGILLIIFVVSMIILIILEYREQMKSIREGRPIKYDYQKTNKMIYPPIFLFIKI